MAVATLRIAEQQQRMAASPSLCRAVRSDLAEIGFPPGLEPRPAEKNDDMGLWLEDIGLPPGLEPGPEEKHKALGESVWSRSTTCSASPYGSGDSADGDGEQSDASKPDPYVQFESMFAQASAPRSTMQGTENACIYLELLAQLGQQNLAAARAPLTTYQNWGYSSVPDCNMNMPKKRFCHDCGAQRAPHYMFCPHCGTSFA